MKHKTAIIDDSQIIYNKEIINLVDFIEKNHAEVKTIFLNDFDKLKKFKLKPNLTFRDLTKINNNDYYYDFFYFLEKNPYNHIYNYLLKIIAIKIIINKKEFKDYNFINNSKKMHDSISILLKSNGKQNKLIISYFKFFKIFISRLILLFKTLFKFLKFFLSIKNNIKPFDPDIIFFSYNAFIKKKKNFFISDYWKGINSLDILKKRNISFLYFPTGSKNSIFNSNNFDNDQQFNHFFLQNFITYPIIFSSLYIYFKLYLNFFFNINNIYKFNNSSSSYLIPLLSHDIENDLFGSQLLTNISYYKTLLSLIPKLTNVKIAFYLFENHPWQRMLNKIWSHYLKSPLVAYQHSTLRKFDFRYFFHNTKDLPIYFATNNKNYFNYLNNFNINSYRVEFLRINIPKYNTNDYKVKNIKNKNILILLDHNFFMNSELFSLLINSKNINNYNIFIKPNPVIGSYNLNFPLDYKLLNDDISKVIVNFDHFIVVGASATSLDILYANKTPIIFSSKNLINMSPVREYKNIFFNNVEILDLYLSKYPLYPKIIKNYYTGLPLKKWSSMIKILSKI